MKRLIYSILKLIMWMVSLLYPYSLNRIIKKIRNILYTCWIRNFIGQMGSNTLIFYPCYLQGGGSKLIKIGSNTHIQKHCILACWTHHGGISYTPSIMIGDNCNIGDYTQLTACNRIVVGDGVLMGRYVLITDNAHGGHSKEEAMVRPSQRKLTSKGEVVIGNNTWIGERVVILPNVHIGDNVIIGANTVVTKDIPSNSVWVGTAAKEIRIFNEY
jgi:acetyltransferase-like isoleucine patch superfamily enzyme